MSGAAAAARERDEAFALIGAAREPGDLFGSGAETGAGGTADAGADAGAARRYRRLARLVHPDANPSDARAGAAFARLTDLWQRRQGRRPGSGSGYGVLMARGDIANLYATADGLLKIARDPADNDLMRREAAALRQLAGVEDRFRAYFPRLTRAERHTDPGTGRARRANVLARLDGFRTLAEAGVAFPGGVDPRDAAWMWRRLLVAAGASARAGVIHGAVLPEHVLIHPGQHGLVLIDWCYSVRVPGPNSTAPSGRLRAVPGGYRSWYPPEVLAGRPAGPDLDIWLATQCMTELTGPRLPGPLAAFARGCQLTSPSYRPADAWALLAELDDLLGRLYGPRRFRPFAMPA
jgi:hypothetical protein